MGRLADLAKAKALKGPVTVTDALGQQRTYKNEAEAEAATQGMTLEHKRGAFFEKKPEAPQAAPVAAKAATKKSEKTS